MSAEKNQAEKILIIYVNAPEDNQLRERLNKQLSPLKRRELIEAWSIADIPPGSDWKSTLEKHLHDADIILLLISPDFVASDYYPSVEMLSTLTKREAGEALVIPILLRPTARELLPFTNLRWLPASAAAVTNWSDIDLAMYHIAKSIGDIVQGGEKLSFPNSTPPRFWSVPYRKNRFFAVRQRELDELHNRFTIDRDSPLAVQAITGLSGLGKTELALEYAFRYYHEYKAVFWLRCDSPQDLIAGFLHIADLLQLSVESTSEEQNVIGKVKQRLAYFDGNWLLIFDNVFDVASIDEFRSRKYEWRRAHYRR